MRPTASIRPFTATATSRVPPRPAPVSEPATWVAWIREIGFTLRMSAALAICVRTLPAARGAQLRGQACPSSWRLGPMPVYRLAKSP